MEWTRISKYHWQRGSDRISAARVRGKIRYSAWQGTTLLGVFDSPDEARGVFGDNA